MPEYRETNGIPICPFCQVGTKRVRDPGHHDDGEFDEEGNESMAWWCGQCGKGYRVLAGKYVAPE